MIQLQIKRERFKLVDQIMDSKALDLSILKKKEQTKRSENEIVFSVLSKSLEKKFTQHLDLNLSISSEVSKSIMNSKISPSVGDDRARSALAADTNVKRVADLPINEYSNIAQRFVEQKCKYFPSYLKQAKKSKSSVSAAETEINSGIQITS